jgi:hypothetical protein
MRYTCPICRQNTFFQFNPPKLANISNFPLSGEIQLDICLNCSFGWNNSASLTDDYNDYYLNFNKHQIRSEFGKLVDGEYFTTILERLNKLVDQNVTNRILDYGSGDRALADIAISLGFYEAACLDVGKNEGNNNEYFQALTCLHSLEHFYDPIQSVSDMNQLLCAGGILYIAVPDAMRYQETYYGAFNAIDLEHINHFTAPSLSALLVRCGFQIMAVEQSDRRVSEEAFYPEIWITAKKTGLPDNAFSKLTMPKEVDNSKFLSVWKDYLLKSNNEFDRLQAWVDKIIEKNSSQRLILYGLGPPALRIAEYLKGNRNIVLGDSDIRLYGKKINQSNIHNLGEILESTQNNASRYLIVAVNGGRVKSYLQENGVLESQISIYEWDK